MPVFRLSAKILFPPPHLAEPNGLLAIGGDLSVKRLIAAYRRGIFPWFSEGDPLLWWSPTPRLVLFPGEFRLPKRLARYARNSVLTTTCDQAFAEVIASCATTRTDNGQPTWITPAMQSAYIELHREGYAHSIEVWRDGCLAGGLYGVSLGRVFFGESMFSRISSGSQFALIALVDTLRNKDFQMIDCQMTTNHLLRFGAREIKGEQFQTLLDNHIDSLISHGTWCNIHENNQ